MLRKLVESGEIRNRVEGLYALLSPCRLCPRECGALRDKGEVGRCGGGMNPAVSSVCDHHGEEPPISGSRGSGTIFFAGCNLKCIFCQNHQISQPKQPLSFYETDVDTLAGSMLRLKKIGAHNINLVSPTHFLPQIVKALSVAATRGLDIPIVYNTNGYDSVEALELLDGVIDIYMPDMKYSDPKWGLKLSNVRDYPRFAKRALKEMYRQVGGLEFDDDGIARRGLLVRHLVLPGGLAGSREVLKFIAEELGNDVYVSLMAQYHPSNYAYRHPTLKRRISIGEYTAALKEMERLGLDGFTQDVQFSPHFYLPDFDKEHPFE